MAFGIRGLAAGILAAAIGLASAQAAPADRRVVLVTLDGMPWTEVFHGADPERAADRAFVTELAAVKKEFVDPPDRARALMPFLHDVVAKQGVLLGDRDHGSCVAVANDQWFSYPGYNEILTGKPDPAIRSNAHGPNRNVTVLEWLNRQPGFKGKVQAVASWTTFRDILSASRSGVPVNAGWDGAPGTPLARLEAEVPRLWPEVRFDAFTQPTLWKRCAKASRARSTSPMGRPTTSPTTAATTRCCGRLGARTPSWPNCGRSCRPIPPTPAGPR